MIQHVWTVVCQKSIIDKDTNNISLDVLEQLKIKISSLPEKAEGIIFPIKIEIVSLWCRGRGEEKIKGDGQLKIEGPNNKVVGNAMIDIDLMSSHRSRTRVRLEGLPIPKGASGVFHFVILLKSENKWIQVARVPLEVDIAIHSVLSDITAGDC